MSAVVRRLEFVAATDVSSQSLKMNFRCYWRFLIWAGSFFLSDVCKLTKGLWMLTKNEVWNTIMDTVVVGVTVVILTKRERHKEMKGFAKVMQIARREETNIDFLSPAVSF